MSLKPKWKAHRLLRPRRSRLLCPCRRKLSYLHFLTVFARRCSLTDRCWEAGSPALLGLNTRSDAAPQLEFDQRRTDQAADEHQQKVCRQPHSVDTSPLKVQVHNIAGGPSPRCWYAMPYGRQRNSSWGASLDGIDLTGSVGASSSSVPGNGMFSKPGQARCIVLNPNCDAFVRSLRRLRRGTAAW